MPRLNRLLKFLFGFILVFVLLIAPWPGLEEAFAGFFKKEIEWVSNILGPKAVIQITKSAKPFDTQINFANEDKRKPDNTYTAAYFSVASRPTAYLPIVLIISLILATPVPLKRRVWALFWGLLLINAVIALKMIVMILYNYNLQTWLELFLLSPFWKKILDYCHLSLANPIGPTLFAGVLIWLLVSFRYDDLKVFLEP